MPELKTLNNWPLLMQPIEHAGGESVPRAVCAHNRARREGDRAQRNPRTVASTHHPTLGEMRRRPTHGAEREHFVDCPCDCGRVGRAVGAPRLASRQRADLVIVDDEIIEMRQAGAAELGELVGSVVINSRLVQRLSARAARNTATQPLASSRHGRSIALWAPGNPRCRIFAVVEKKSKSSGVISAATP